MPQEEDPRYRFIYETVCKQTDTKLKFEQIRSSVDVARFCDDTATTLLCCVYHKNGRFFGLFEFLAFGFLNLAKSYSF